MKGAFDRWLKGERECVEDVVVGITLHILNVSEYSYFFVFYFLVLYGWRPAQSIRY